MRFERIALSLIPNMSDMMDPMDLDIVIDSDDDDSVSSETVATTLSRLTCYELDSSESTHDDSDPANTAMIDSIEDPKHVYAMLPPPIATYTSYKAMHVSALAWSAEHGYDLVIESSRSNRKHVTCSQYGKTQNNRQVTSVTRQRKCATIKCGCPFHFYYTAVDKSNPHGEWTIEYDPLSIAKHNHFPIMKGQAMANQRRRQRGDKIIQIIREHTQTGISTRQTLSYLRQKFPNALQTSRDLTNIKSMIRQQIRKTMTVIDATIKQLEALNFYYRYETELIDASAEISAKRLKRIFIAHPRSVQLYQRFNDVIVLDNTYKTNRYGRPVLNICGVTGSNKTIQIALAMLGGEDEEQYSWALLQLSELMHVQDIKLPSLFLTDRDAACINALKTHFPDSHFRLCMWHMNKDVKAYCRSKLGMVANAEKDSAEAFVDTEQSIEFFAQYKQTIFAATEEEFTERCKALLQIWPDGYAYLERTWFNRYSDLCAAFSTNNMLHFGISSTSRVEGSHADMKKWLQNSRSDIYGFVDRLLPWWTEQYHNIMVNISEQSVSAPIEMCQAFYIPVLQQLWHYALYKVQEQYRLASAQLKKLNAKTEAEEPKLEECTNAFTTQWGLPCSHTIRDLRMCNKQLTLAHFDRHWIIQTSGFGDTNVTAEELGIQEPICLPRRKRIGPKQTKSSNKRKTGTGAHGTRRDNLFAEVVDLNHPASSQKLKRTPRQSYDIEAFNASLASQRFANTPQAS